MSLKGGETMATTQEINKESAEKLYDLLMIKKANENIVVKQLNSIIARTKSSMSKEAIAWVEQQVEQSDN
jgi:hypothetical protein